MIEAIDIRHCSEMDYPAYEQFLEKNAELPLYGSPHFLKFIEAVTPCATHILLAFDGLEIVGSLPYAVIRQLGIGRIVNSLPWYGSHGSVVLDRESGEVDEVRCALLARFAAEIESDDLLSMTMILLPEEQQHIETYKSILTAEAMDSRIGQITDLPTLNASPIESLEAVLLQKTRNLVRKSLKQNFVELITDEPWAWDYLASTHAENMAAIGGRAKPAEHFKAIRSTIPPEMRRLSVAMSGEHPAAAMLLFVTGQTCEYITPVISKDFRPRQPLSFLIWCGMLDALCSGRRRWNWGGTWLGQENLHHFKAGFGALDRQYSYLVRATSPAVSKIRGLKDQLGMLFPYFYVFPYAEL